VFRNMMNAARFERYTEEKVLAGLRDMQTEALYKGQSPPVATQAAYLQVSASYNLQVQDELRRRRELGFLAVMLEVEKSHVPFPDEPPIHFPPLATWQKILEYRKAKYEVTGLPDDMEGRKEAQKISRLLEEPIEMKDFQLPMTLKEALGLFYEKMAAKGLELPILVDTEAFKDGNNDAPDIYDTPVKFPPFPRRMSLATALRMALSKIPTGNATYLIRRNFIEITTIERQTSERTLRVYPVGDLVIPISSPFNPFAGQGAGGVGLGGMNGFGGMPGMGMGGMGMGGMGMGGMGMGGFPGMGGMGFGNAGFGGVGGVGGVPVGGGVALGGGF